MDLKQNSESTSDTGLNLGNLVIDDSSFKPIEGLVEELGETPEETQPGASEETPESSVDGSEQTSDDGDTGQEQPEPPQADDLEKALGEARQQLAQKDERLAAFEAAYARQQAVSQLPAVPPIVPYDKLSPQDQARVDQHAEYYGISPFDAAYQIQSEVRNHLLAQRSQLESQLVGNYQAVTSQAVGAVKGASEAELQRLHEIGFAQSFNHLVAAGAPAEAVAKYVESSLAAVKALSEKDSRQKTAAKDITSASRDALKRNTRGELSRQGSSPTGATTSKSSATQENDLTQALKLFHQNDPAYILDKVLFKKK